MRELAVELNNRGLYMQEVLKPSWDIEWTEETVKDNLVRPIAEAYARKTHTHELSTKELSDIVDILDKNLLQKFDVNLPFSYDE